MWVGDYAKFKHVEPQTGFGNTWEIERIDAKVNTGSSVEIPGK